MEEVLFSSGKIGVVIAVLVIIFLGLTVYLFMLDRKLNKLEREVNKKEDRASSEGRSGHPNSGL